MKNEIVERAINDLQRIGMPGSAERLRQYILELEKKANATHTLDREHWRRTFAGEFLAAEIAIGSGLCDSDYASAVKRSERLLGALEGSK